MFQSLDIATLRVSSILVSSSFGLVFACLFWLRRSDRHYAHWAASSLLYACAIIGFQLVPPSIAASVGLFGLLGLTDILIISGLYSLDGARPFRPWMLLPICAAIAGKVLPHLAGLASLHLPSPVARACEPLGLALAMGVTGACLLRRATPDGRMAGVAGLALLAYLPGYAFTIVAELGFAPRANLLALVPMLSDQVLLGVLNLALLAIPVEQAQRQLSDAALRDPLTRAWNRAGLEAQWDLVRDQAATLLAIDVDHFKAVNDEHGHAAGDEVLIALARIAGARATLAGGLFVRMGGDEFVAILPAIDRAGAIGFSEGLRRDLAEQCQVPCTISIGMATVEPGDGSVGPALRRADTALYRAKRQGRNRLAAYPGVNALMTA